MEDEILDHLDRVDRLQKEIVIAQDRVKQAEADKTKYAGEYAADEPVLKKKEADLLTGLSKAESVLAGETLTQYRRVVEAHGAEAMAPVENGVCTGCYVALRPQQKVQLNNGVIHLLQQLRPPALSHAVSGTARAPPAACVHSCYGVIVESPVYTYAALSAASALSGI